MTCPYHETICRHGASAVSAAHIEGCIECRALVRRLEEARRVLRAHSPEPPLGIEHRILSAANSRHVPRIGYTGLAATAIAAAALAIATVWMPSDSPSPDASQTSWRIASGDTVEIGALTVVAVEDTVISMNTPDALTLSSGTVQIASKSTKGTGPFLLMTDDARIELTPLATVHIDTTGQHTELRVDAGRARAIPVDGRKAPHWLRAGARWSSEVARTRPLDPRSRSDNTTVPSSSTATPVTAAPAVPGPRARTEIAASPKDMGAEHRGRGDQPPPPPSTAPAPRRATTGRTASGDRPLSVAPPGAVMRPAPDDRTASGDRPLPVTPPGAVARPAPDDRTASVDRPLPVTPPGAVVRSATVDRPLPVAPLKSVARSISVDRTTSIARPLPEAPPGAIVRPAPVTPAIDRVALADRYRRGERIRDAVSLYRTVATDVRAHADDREYSALQAALLLEKSGETRAALGMLTGLPLAWTEGALIPERVRLAARLHTKRGNVQQAARIVERAPHQSASAVVEARLYVARVLRQSDRERAIALLERADLSSVDPSLARTVANELRNSAQKK